MAWVIRAAAAQRRPLIAQPVLSLITRGRPHASFSTAAPSTDLRLMRFLGTDGEEYFGTFVAGSETHACVAQRSAVTHKMAMTTSIQEVDMVLPPCDPPQIFAIGLNYSDHAAEVKMPLPERPIVFMKSINTLIGHGGAIVIPSCARDPPEVDYEAELAVVIGKNCRNVSPAEAMDYVLGYTIANDVTARRWQGKKGGGQWIRGKCFDTFLPLGPHISPKSAVDLSNTPIRTWVNGDLVQDGNTRDMIRGVPELVAFLSQGTTLLPGSVVLTGTPAGVGYTRGVFLKAGDIVRIDIGGIGTLRNIVAEEITE